MKKIAFIIFVLNFFVLPVKADESFDGTAIGEFSGKLLVEWISSDLFVFRPDDLDPFVFKRNNGETIVPGPMLTDGGTIPRPLWVLRNYGPWGYAPAYIVHDWLFYSKYCGESPGKDVEFGYTVDVFGEALKTMMKRDDFEDEVGTFNNMVAAVSSRVARKYWREGECDPIPLSFDSSNVKME